MVNTSNIDDQIKKIKFVTNIWNRPEITELSNIILADEEIFECVNGWYQGGFALLVATNIRILLIDKKPFRFLAIEDVRFDTITQIDYGHRFLDAHIGINTGMKELKFKSYNKDRLRKLIGHVQHRMAEIKLEQADHSKDQKNHLEQIDSQLKTYLLAQYEQHNALTKQLSRQNSIPHEELNIQNGIKNEGVDFNSSAILPEVIYKEGYNLASTAPNGITSEDLYREGIKEVYAKKEVPVINPNLDENQGVNPLKIAYSKLPMILRDRKRTTTYLSGINKAEYSPGAD